MNYVTIKEMAKSLKLLGLWLRIDNNASQNYDIDVDKLV